MAKIERTKNASRNIIFGILLQLYRIVVPFLMRTAMIYFMGIQYLGLNSLFTSVLHVLNLAELGVGSAMVYSMYKPIANDDNSTICALMKLYRKYYRLIGLIIAAVGISISPFIPKLINGSVPDDVNVYILYFLNLAATVLSYWLFAYKNSLLTAHQRNDVISKITIITDTFQYAIQLLVLWLFKNYYYFVITIIVTQIANNIITAACVNKMYPTFQPKGELSKSEIKQINQRIKDLFSAKFGTVLGSSVDTIVISAGIGLTALAVYQNYYYIMNAVIVMISIIFNSVRAGIGNSIIVENPEKNYNDFKTLTFIILWIGTVCITCFVTVYQPFMVIWVGEEYLLPFYMVILFSLYFFLVVIQNLACTYKDASGIWHEDRYRPLIAGIFNFTLNILLVRRWGLMGILLSTIISHLFIAMPWVIHNLFKLVFKRGLKEFIFMLIRSLIITVMISSIAYYICAVIPVTGALLKVCVNVLISMIVSNCVLLVCYYKSAQFKRVCSIIKVILKR